MEDFTTEIENIKGGMSINVIPRDSKGGERCSYLISDSDSGLLFSVNGLLYTEGELISFLNIKVKDNYYIEYN